MGPASAPLASLPGVCTWVPTAPHTYLHPYIGTGDGYTFLWGACGLPRQSSCCGICLFREQVCADSSRMGQQTGLLLRRCLKDQDTIRAGEWKAVQQACGWLVGLRGFIGSGRPRR